MRLVYCRINKLSTDNRSEDLTQGLNRYGSTYRMEPWSQSSGWVMWRSPLPKGILGDPHLSHMMPLRNFKKRFGHVKQAKLNTRSTVALAAGIVRNWRAIAPLNFHSLVVIWRQVDRSIGYRREEWYRGKFIGKLRVAIWRIPPMNLPHSPNKTCQLANQLA
jgi:hypothetical protein